MGNCFGKEQYAEIKTDHPPPSSTSTSNTNNGRESSSSQKRSPANNNELTVVIDPLLSVTFRLDTMNNIILSQADAGAAIAVIKPDTGARKGSASSSVPSQLNIAQKFLFSVMTGTNVLDLTDDAATLAFGAGVKAKKNMIDANTNTPQRFAEALLKRLTEPKVKGHFQASKQFVVLCPWLTSDNSTLNTALMPQFVTALESRPTETALEKPLRIIIPVTQPNWEVAQAIVSTRQ